MISWVQGRALRFQAIATGIVCAIALFVAAPNFFPARTVLTAWPDWLPDRQFKLGVAYVGGTSLLLQPNMDYVQRTLLRDLRDKIRKELRDHRIRYEALRFDASSVRLHFPDSGQLPGGIRIVQRVALEWDRMPAGTSAGYRVHVTSADQVRVQMTDDLRSVLRERILRSRLDELNCNKDWLSASREGNAIRLVLPSNFRERAHVYRWRC